MKHGLKQLDFFWYVQKEGMVQIRFFRIKDSFKIKSCFFFKNCNSLFFFCTTKFLRYPWQKVLGSPKTLNTECESHYCNASKHKFASLFYNSHSWKKFRCWFYFWSLEWFNERICKFFSFYFFVRTVGEKSGKHKILSVSLSEYESAANLIPVKFQPLSHKQKVSHNSICALGDNDTRQACCNIFRLARTFTFFQDRSTTIIWINIPPN